MFIGNNLNLSRFFDKNQPRTENNPFWIYPLHILELKPELVCSTADATGYNDHDPLSGACINYLSFTLTLDDPGTLFSTYTLRRYVKRRTLPFPTMQYVFYNSNRPVSSVMGIATSQLLPILYVHSSAEGATSELADLVRQLVHRNFPYRKLCRQLQDKLCNDPYPGLRFDTDLVIVG